MFDPTIGRWFLTDVEISQETRFHFLKVAVSKTKNPLGSYFIYTFIVGFSPECGIDFPCIVTNPRAGYDANGLYISVNLFGFGRDAKGFVGATTYALPKSKLVAGAASFTSVRIVHPGDFMVQPSVPAPGEPFETAANGTEYLMEARNIVDRSRKVRIWAISNTKNIVTAPNTLRAFFIDVAVANYGPTVPATEPNVIGPVCKSRGATAAPFLDGGLWTFQATVQKASRKLYGALPFGTRDGQGLLRDFVAWFALKPSVNSFTGYPSALIVNQGYVVAPNGYSLLNPAFGLNKSGAGALGFTITNRSASVPGGFPSAGFIQFTGTGRAGGIKISGQGIASDDLGFPCSGTPPVVGPWGTYGAATVDAATGFFYTANENISGARAPNSNWGTFITQLH